MHKLVLVLGSIWSWIALAGSLVVGLPIMAVTRLATRSRDPGRYWTGRIFRIAGMVAARLNPLWRFRWSGRPPTDPRHPYVVVSNHESFADILLISFLPWEMKWLSKASFFRIPVVGWMMSLAGDIPVHRGDARSAARAMLACRDRLRRGVSVMIFPEGTRSMKPDLLPFKDGAFRLAIDEQLPILPLALAGTRTALPKKGFVMQRADAEVTILEPIDTKGMTTKDVPELRDRVQKMITEARAEILGRVGSGTD